MDLPTYTNIWRIEKRLYKLYDLRLPMPLPIVWIGVFVGVLAPWSLLLWLVGIDFVAPWHVLYLVPPGIVTWLSTRPVIENKRLTELLQSQARYVGEPRVWCRMAPAAEPETIAFSGRVWRAVPARVRVKATRKARHSQRRRAAERPAGPRQVRPAVAAAAAAAAQAPLSEPATAGRTGWGSITRRGTAPALLQELDVRNDAAPSHLPDGQGSSPASARRPDPERAADRTGETAREAAPTSETRTSGEPAHTPERPAAWGAVPMPGRTEQRDVREAEERGVRGGGLDAPTPRETQAGGGAPASQSRKPADRPGPVVGKPIDTEALRRLRRLAASADTKPSTPALPPSPPPTASTDGANAADTAAPAETAAAGGAVPTASPSAATSTVEDPTQKSPSVAGEAVASAPAEGGFAEETTPAEGESVEEPASVVGEAAVTALADEAAPAVSPSSTEPGEGVPAGVGDGGLERSGDGAAGGTLEDEAARIQHRKGQPPRQNRSLGVPDTPPVWPLLRPDTKLVTKPVTLRPIGGGARDTSAPAQAARHDEPSLPVPSGRDGEGAADQGRQREPEGASALGEGVRVPAARRDSESAPEARPDAVQASEAAGSEVDGAREVGGRGESGVREAGGGAEPGVRVAGGRDGRGEDVAARRGEGALAGRSEGAGRDERVGGRAEARRHGGDGRAGDAVVPGPRFGEREGRVRRVESVVGRDSGGWRRIAQVVVGGGGVRTDGSEIDEARARGVFSGSRRVVVLGCTGGAGQSTTALMLGHTFARYRDDRVVAVDASTGGNTLTSRVRTETPETLASLLSGLDRVSGYLTMRGYTTRTASGLEVIGADTDAEAERRLTDRTLLSDHRLGQTMHLLDRHYKLAVIDPAAALAARVLPYADQLVLVVPASEEAPEAVAMTYEWLDGHGCADLRRRAVMVVNGVSRRSMADVEQAEAVARGRCRAIVRVPWEDDLAPGGADVVDPGQLRAAGRRAYLALAGVVVAGFAAQTIRPSEEELASDPPGTRIGER
ncbi:TcpE family conjugal transfer membrane protein [Nonomuraea sp. NPDC005983]|uniref:TcpE family conjugal transfer membrane protein n=1 Tax=Nonomuraea sp. NPDC005983 TaxID=3155595 RepID=UPI0033B1EB27